MTDPADSPIRMRPTGSPGTGWAATGPGVLRNSRNGRTGVPGVYYRFESQHEYAPPYVWSGSIRTRSLMTPPVFKNGNPAHYRPGLVFHPMYGSSMTPAAGNDENVLIGLGTYDRPEGHVGISAELRAERPDRPYGARSGYARKHETQPAPFPFWDGLWHNFEIVVHSHSHYTLSWDGVMLADILEDTPPTIPGGKCRVGLRCDFTDIEIKDFTVTTEAEPVITYPDGYGTERITLDVMKARHADRMHPEFAHRFFAYMEAKGGLLGVGGGWRATGAQPDRPGFAPEGESFHQSQTFASGIVGYAAVDLVTGNGKRKHKAPPWSATGDAASYRLHTFVKGEPWHIQPVEIRGWQAWKNAGSPDPISTEPIEPIEDDMPTYLAHAPKSLQGTDGGYVLVISQGAVRYACSHDVTFSLPEYTFTDDTQGHAQYATMLRCAGIVA